MSEELQIVVHGEYPRPQVELAPSAFTAREVAIAKAQQITEITSITDLDDAAVALTLVKSLTRSVEDSRKEVKAPVLDIGKKIDQVAKDYLAPLEVEAKRLSVMVGSYQEAQRRKAERARQEAAEKEAAAMEALRIEQVAAVAEGDAEAADAARAKAADAIAEAQLDLQAASGPHLDNVTTRTNWKFEVTDIEELYKSAPHLCVIEPNNAAIRAVIKASNGKAVKGLRIWNEAAAIIRNTKTVNPEQYDY